MAHIILANWKMSPRSGKEAQALFDKTKDAVGRLRSVDVILAPPVVFMQMLASKYGGNKIAFAAQHISTHEEVAHTGSISAEQCASVGAGYVLIGHSESGDTIDDLRVKTFLALKHKLRPIVFVGESERDAGGHYLKVVREQMLTSLEELSDTKLSEVIFCYEPVWAVGQEQPMDAYEVHAMVLYMRKVLVEAYGATVARKVQILYGGSVNEETIVQILTISDLDGVAVGRASTDAGRFTELLKVANKV
jgi:triosephosphate isomerase